MFVPWETYPNCYFPLLPRGWAHRDGECDADQVASISSDVTVMMAMLWAAPANVSLDWSAFAVTEAMASSDPTVVMASTLPSSAVEREGRILPGLGRQARVQWPETTDRSRIGRRT